MQIETITAMVLHRRPYRETSYLVDAFSAEMGKVSFIAKGVKSAKGQSKSLLQPFQLLSMDLFGRHELKNLRQVEAADGAIHLQDKYLFSGLYLNELLNRILQKELAAPTVFKAYYLALKTLSEQRAIEPVLREFELLLLTELGYGFDFESDWQTSDPIKPQHYYSFVSEHGFQKLAMAIQSNNCFLGQDLLDIQQHRWHSSSLATAKKLSRIALHPLLGGKPLKSRELFLQLEQTI